MSNVQGCRGGSYIWTFNQGLGFSFVVPAGSAQDQLGGDGRSTMQSYDLEDSQSLVRFLQDAEIRLVRLEYLVELQKAERVFPRRQEAETETTRCGQTALVDASELARLEIDERTGHISTMINFPWPPRRVTVNLVSISHAWESMEHPDPWRPGERCAVRRM